MDFVPHLPAFPTTYYGIIDESRNPWVRTNLEITLIISPYSFRALVLLPPELFFHFPLISEILSFSKIHLSYCLSWNISLIIFFLTTKLHTSHLPHGVIVTYVIFSSHFLGYKPFMGKASALPDSVFLAWYMRMCG